MGAAHGAPLWQIGTADAAASEFALAPDGFANYAEDGFFAVGVSDPACEWPYVHPGPDDTWAGGRPHRFTIVFELRQAPRKGDAILQLDLVDTHWGHPPRLAVDINGERFARVLPKGSGDDSAIHGAFDRGKQCLVEIPFPAVLLRQGSNEIGIDSRAGSWFLYDAVTLVAPESAVLAEPRPLADQIGDPVSPAVLCDHEGTLDQVVRIPVRHFGDPRVVRVKVGDGPSETRTLEAGSQMIEIHVPAVDRETTVKVSLRIDDTVLAERNAVLRPVRRWEIYLLHHTHLDIGYTHVQTEVEARQWSHLERAMELAKQTADYPPDARFKWLPEGLWAVDSYLAQAAPEQREAFVQAVRDGSIGLDALYGNELTALCRPEELLELTGYARRFAAEYGVTIDSAMISDVPGYTWGLIPVLAHSGVKYFSIGPNAGHRIGYTLSAWGDKPFYWVSPSGQEKVLCWVAAKAYSWFHGQPLRDDERLLGYLDELERGGFPYDIIQVRYNIGGDNGPPDPELPDFVKAWNERYAYPKLRIATTSELFTAFERRYGAELPEVRGDFTPYWEDGAASSALETATNRAAAERIVQAQILYGLFHAEDYPAAEFVAAWREAILYDEHTWGAHNSISEPECDFVRQQWKIKQDFAVNADRRSRELLDKAVAPFANHGDQVAAVLVFNTATWPRTDVVLLPVDWHVRGPRVLDANGHVVPSQVLASGELAFLAADIPPLGATRFAFEAGTAQASGDARADGTGLSNGLVSVTLDGESGAVASLQRRGIDAEFVSREGGMGLNDYFYVAGRDPKQPQRNGPVSVSVKDAGPLVASVSIQSDAPGCRGLTRELRVFSGLDRVDIVTMMDKENIYDKEAVHLAFPFNVPDAVTRLDLPWAVARVELDQMPGACKNYFTVQRWADVSNEAYGVTWATLDAPLIEVGAITCDPVVVSWLTETPKPVSTLYSYVMNNYWETNYKASQEGPTVFRYSVRPHGAYDQVLTQRFGIERSQPLVVVPAEADAVAPRAPFSMKGEQAILTSLTPSARENGLDARVFNGGCVAGDVAFEGVSASPATLAPMEIRTVRLAQ